MPVRLQANDQRINAAPPVRVCVAGNRRRFQALGFLLLVPSCSITGVKAELAGAESDEPEMFRLLEDPPRSHRAVCLNYIIRQNVAMWKSETIPPDAWSPHTKFRQRLELPWQILDDYEEEGCNVVFAGIMYLCTDFHAVDQIKTFPPKGKEVASEAEFADLVRSCIARTEAMKIFPSPGTLDERGWQALQKPR